MRILLVEDDESVTQVLQSVLGEAHYAVDIACDGEMGWQMLSAADYDLILLDVILPKLGGLDFCKQLRDSDYDVPVLLVTALDSSQEKIAGLNAGADDYITKPFEIGELLARVRALLRRVKTSVVSVLEWGEVCLQPDSHEVSYGSCKLSLTPKEYGLLELFLRHPVQVFSRSAILDNLWDYSDAPGEETVTSHVKGLRKKLSKAGAPDDFVQTVYGVGYRLRPLLTESEDVAVLPAESTAEQQNEQGLKPQSKLEHHKIKAAIATLWQSAKYKQLERLNQLADAEKILRSRQLLPEERHNAYQLAHSLSGALGIFGFLEESHISHEIQIMMDGNTPFSSPEKANLKAMLEALRSVIAQGAQVAEPEQPEVNDSKLPLLLLLDTALDIGSELVNMLWAAGLSVKISSDARSTRNLFAALAQDEENQLLRTLTKEGELPDVVLLRFAIAEIDIEKLDRLIGTTRPVSQLNAMICSASSRLGDRVKVARLGHYPFLTNPSADAVVKGVQKMRSRQQTLPCRLLAVDDDRQLLNVLSDRLSQKGFQVDTLEQPLNFWQQLQTSNPDLLLLDIEMPRFNGFELCQAVRQAPRWSHLPIVFFTIHADSQTVQAAIEAGADDLVEKTMSDTALFIRLMSHLERSSLQQVTNAISNK